VLALTRTIEPPVRSTRNGVRIPVTACVARASLCYQHPGEYHEVGAAMASHCRATTLPSRRVQRQDHLGREPDVNITVSTVDCASHPSIAERQTATARA
jgi:hypothetical protein